MKRETIAKRIKQVCISTIVYTVLGILAIIGCVMYSLVVVFALLLFYSRVIKFIFKSTKRVVFNK